jgi:four helix bundle protein
MTKFLTAVRQAKHKINTKHKFQTMNKKYDLEERTLKFAQDCIDLAKLILKNSINIELISQFIRASGSIGANYREANDSVTKKDFYHRINISRREAKETKYWLELILHSNPNLHTEVTTLIDEAYQLTKIFAAIAQNNG